MTVLITGSDGFVGSHLLETCPASLGQIFSPTFNELDLTDSQSVRDYLAGKKIHYCIHSATTLRNKTTYPTNVCELNLRMFFNLVRYLPEDCRIVNLGSGSEYTRELWHDNMQEESFLDSIPKDSHSLSKYIISKFIHTNTHDRLVTLRIFGIYGEREHYLYKFISNTIVKTLYGISANINQDAVFNYIDVRDFCSVLYLLLPKPELYCLGSVNVGYPHNYKLSDITSYILDLTGKTQTLPYKVLSSTMGNPYTPSLQRMQSLLPVSYQFTPILDSISRLISYYSSILQTLNLDMLIADDYLNYAKSIMKQ